MEQDNHFASMTSALTLFIKGRAESFSEMLRRREADRGIKKIEIKETLAEDSTGIVKVRYEDLSWEISSLELLSNQCNEQLPWYLGTYAELDPLDTWRAEPIAEELCGYGQRLFSSLEFERLRDRIDESTSLLTINVHHPTHGSKFPETPWEALEEPSLWAERSIKARVIVRRVYQGMPKIRVRARKTFNILYVVARPLQHTRRTNREGIERIDLKGTDSINEGTDRINLEGYIDHRLLSKSVVQTINAMQEESIQVELHMLRPGPFKAFKDHLIQIHKKTGQRGYYDLVHFDMHGSVHCDEKGPRYKLGFLDKNSLETEWVDARSVATVLKCHDIPAAFLNACESANTRQQMELNFAKDLVQHGVAIVVAMSFKLSTSAAEMFIDAFYRKLLDGVPNYNGAVLAGRNALRSQPTRKANLGLTVQVQDWVIPVLYIDTAKIILTVNYTGSQLMTFYTLEGQLHSPWQLISPERARYELHKLNNPTPTDRPRLSTVMGEFDPGFVGRDFEILWIEHILCKGNILRIYGPPSVGKTCLANQLGAWWVRTYYASFVHILLCSSTDYPSQLNDVAAGRCTISGVQLPTVSHHSCRNVLDPPRILIFDDLDELDKSVTGSDDLKFRLTCEALARVMTSGAKLVFISRKRQLQFEASHPDSALSVILKTANSFELKPFSRPDAAALGSKLLNEKGETVGTDDVRTLRCIYQELDNIPGAIQKIMAHCSLREENRHPKQMLEKLRVGIPFNEIADEDTEIEMIEACVGGGANMQISMLFLAPFSHHVFENEAHDDLLDFLSWPVRYEGFAPHGGETNSAIVLIRRVLEQHGRPEEYSEAMTNDSDAAFLARRYILLGHLLKAIEIFTSVGYIIPEKKKKAPALWIHPVLTAFLRQFLRVKMPQMKPRIERSFVHFMLKKKFTPESWTHEATYSSQDPRQVSLRGFLDNRIQREPWNYVRAVVLGLDFIDEKQGDGIVISLTDYLDALVHILIALGGSNEEEGVNVMMDIAERVVDKYFLRSGQDAFTETLADNELEAVLSMLKELSDREIRVRRQAGHRSARKYLKDAVDIGERYRLIGRSQHILDRCKASLRWLEGEDYLQEPQTTEDGLSTDYISVQNLAFASRQAAIGDEAVLKEFRAYLSVLQSIFGSGGTLKNSWEQDLLISLDIDRNDYEFAEIALAYGRYSDHENNTELSELCFQIERQMIRKSYTPAKRMALNGLERSLDAGNRYGEFDFRRYLIEIAECTSEGNTAAQLRELRSLCQTINLSSTEWCVCWRHIVYAEKAVARGDNVAARKSYLLSLKEAHQACEDESHFMRVASYLVAEEILPEATLMFLELCRQRTLETGSYDPKCFYFLLKSLFQIEIVPELECFVHSAIFRSDSEALQELQKLTGLSERALIEPLIRAYLALIEASVMPVIGDGQSTVLTEIARRRQHFIFGTGNVNVVSQTSTTATTFSVTNQRFLNWIGTHIQNVASHEDCVKRNNPAWGRFGFMRWGIIAEGDELMPVIVGPDSSDSSDISDDEVQIERPKIGFISRLLKSCSCEK